MAPKQEAKKQANKKYTYKALRSAVEKLDVEKIREIFMASPQLITYPKPNENVLKFACISGKTAVVQQLLRLTLKDYNPHTDKFINDSITQCIRFEKFDMVRKFVQNGFDLNCVVFQQDGIAFTCIDFAILGGHYEIGHYIFNRIDHQLKNLRNVKEYELLGKKYMYRYVNYEMVIEGLVNNVGPDQIGNYLKKQLSDKRKEEIRRIHHQGCWQWFMRMIGIGKTKDKQKDKDNVDPNPQNVNTNRPFKIK